VADVAAAVAAAVVDRESEKMNRISVLKWGMRVLIAAGVCVPVSVWAQQSYPSAEAAADAFVDAIATSDQAALTKILGADWRRFVPSHEIYRSDINRFLAAAAKSRKLIETGPDSAALEVGGEGWTLPVPIVKGAQGWHFDTRAGAEGMQIRRVGRNERGAMQAALAYYDAQKDYAGVDRDGDGVLQYAQKFVSSKGKRDGLYWPSVAGESESPLGPLIADLKPGEGYHGYRYKILKKQGPAAPGGAYDYVIRDRMVGGFALIAWPVKYGETGIMSFALSHDGRVYQKDLGPQSAAAAQAVEKFNPDESWKPVDAPTPPGGAS
jgi:hypothetical protein